MAVGIPIAITALVVIVLAAFIPCLLYLEWVRNHEQTEREPWSELIKMFAWGAFVGTTIALILNTVSGEYLAAVVGASLAAGVLLPIVIAPIVEEAAKGLGLRFVKDPFIEEEDGIVYGAAVGFGFAATENVLYALTALATGGVVAYVIVALLRTLSSALLHASASSLLGYGWSKRRAMRLHGEGTISLVPYYLGAVGLHALFNTIAVAGGILVGGVALFALISLPTGILIAWVAIILQRKKLREIEDLRHAREARRIAEATPPAVDPYAAYAREPTHEPHARPAEWSDAPDPGSGEPEWDEPPR